MSPRKTKSYGSPSNGKKQRIKTTAKGGKNERRCRDLLRAHGYEVIVSRLSKGAFDREAVRGNGALGGVDYERRYIQIKSNRWPGTAELARMAAVALPEGSTREAWRVMDVKTIGRGRKFDPRNHIQAKRYDGTAWAEISLLPEWRTESRPE